ncbi:fimbrial protein [Serratia microhaemolytica]|uniref:fimbrial protein n=1 Tax=Serratia microhaemolytica TaxID=2675110 RepID=UPI000FDD9A37|nr:hypothetical protein [Serratia microhaemolytica]
MTHRALFQTQHATPHYGWKMWATLLLLAAPGIASAAVAGPSGTYTVGAGKVWSTPLSWSASIAQASWDPTINPYRHVGGALTTTLPDVGGGCMNTSKIATLSTGAITGYKIAEDVILAMTAGNITGTYYNQISGTTKTTVTGRWAANGAFTTTTIATSPWCVGLSSNDIGARLVRYETGTSLNNGVMALYIGPNAKTGTYTVPNFYLTQFNDTNVIFPVVLQTSKFTISPPTDCTVSFQDSNVSFGMVSYNSADKEQLAVFPSQLNINCPSVVDQGNNTTTVKLAFSGNSGRTTDTLMLKGSSGASMAEIRGVRTANTAGCSSLDAAQIQFNGQSVDVPNVGVGQTAIPLTWTLCSNAASEYGLGTAQATATITWP